MADSGVSSRNAREATLWRIVRLIHLRLIGHFTGVDLLGRSRAEQEQALLKWHAKMEVDVDALAEVMDAARAAGVTAAHVRMHVLEGVDHEMVDQAIDGARSDEDA